MSLLNCVNCPRFRCATSTKVSRTSTVDNYNHESTVCQDQQQMSWVLGSCVVRRLKRAIKCSCTFWQVRNFEAVNAVVQSHRGDANFQISIQTAAVSGVHETFRARGHVFRIPRDNSQIIQTDKSLLNAKNINSSAYAFATALLFLSRPFQHVLVRFGRLRSFFFSYFPRKRTAATKLRVYQFTCSEHLFIQSIMAGTPAPGHLTRYYPASDRSWLSEINI